MNIIVKTQKDFDTIPLTATSWRYVYIKETSERVTVNRRLENASVEAWGNASVVAWGNASVEAWENASVVARGNVAVRLQSDVASVALFAFAVCWALAKGKITRKSKTCKVMTPKATNGLNGWLEAEAIPPGAVVTLYKRVSADFITQEGTPNATKWVPGETLEHAIWNPKEAECGAGKFHACSRPYFCNEFRDKKGDRYVAISVSRGDLYAWPNAEYPHKIAFRKGTVLHEVDRLGKKIEKKT